MALSARFFLAIALITVMISGSPRPSAASGGGGGGGGFQAPSASVPAYDPAVEYQKGVDALKASDFRTAERAFQNALSVSPRDADSNLMLGIARIGRQDWKGARKALEKAVKYDDSLIEGHLQLGVVYAKLGETEKAAAELDWLTRKQNACNDSCADKAALQNAVAAVQAAVAAGKQAWAKPPKSMLFAASQAGDSAYLDAVSLINERRYEAAIQSLETAKHAFGPHPDILTYLGYANRKLRRYDVAERYYREALRIAPGHRGATEYYGEMMMERGDFAGARRMLAKLDRQCAFGCAEAEELRRWMSAGSSDS